MPNYENIRPYSEFCHDAALSGGVEKHLDNIRNISYMMGVQDGKSEGVQIGVLLIFAVLPLWELGKAGFRRLQRHHLKKKEQRQTDIAQVRESERILKQNAEMEG